jgi:MFS family permease
VLGLTANVTIAAVMLAASSAAFAIANMTAVTMRQRRVPDGLLGRVTSLYGTVAGGAEALGALAGGAIATAAGNPRHHGPHRWPHRHRRHPVRVAPPA